MNPIFKRRSIRKFSDDEVSINQVKNLIKTGMQAPSAFNAQHGNLSLFLIKKI